MHAVFVGGSYRAPDPHLFPLACVTVDAKRHGVMVVAMVVWSCVGHTVFALWQPQRLQLLVLTQRQLLAVVGSC